MATLQRSMSKLITKSTILTAVAKTRPSNPVNSFRRHQIQDIVSNRSFFPTTEFRAFSRAYSSSSKITSAYNYNPNDKTLEKLVSGAIETAIANNQRLVEPEHLMKFLLEKKDGKASARKILEKAGIDHRSAVQFVDDFISQQPKAWPKVVAGDITSDRILVGSDLKFLQEKAKNLQKEMKQKSISMEHILLAFNSDRCFGQKLFREFGVSEKDLKVAFSAARNRKDREDFNWRDRVTAYSVIIIVMFGYSSLSVILFDFFRDMMRL